MSAYSDLILSHSPVLFWRLGESSGTNANDETANNLDGTYVNTPTLGVIGALAGDADTAVTFTAASSEHVLANNASATQLQLPAFTLEVWIKIAANPASTQTFIKRARNFELNLATSGKLSLNFPFLGDCGLSTTALPLNQWNHIAVTYDGTTGRYYLNGVADGSGSPGGSIDTNLAQALSVGGDPVGGSYLDGSLDEFAVYGSALSGAQILEHFTLGLNGVPPPRLIPLVRERYPLRTHHEIEAPNGRRYRWSETDRNPANVPRDVRDSNAMPGGFESAGAVLPRKPRIDYGDLQRLSTWRIRGVGGDVISETRLEEAPMQSGDEVSISPSAVGWQAHLDDNKLASFIAVDRDLGNWVGNSVAYTAANAASFDLGEFSETPDETTGLPGLVGQTSDPPFTNPAVLGWYDAGTGNEIASAHIKPTLLAFTLPDANLSHAISTASDDLATGYAGQDLKASNAARTTITFTTARRWVVVVLSYTGAGAGVAGKTYGAREEELALFGDTGLTKRGTAPSEGYYASDIIAYGLRQFCPLLNFTEGADGTLKPSDFVLTQAAWRDKTTMAEILREANRVHLRDWAVWEGPTFHYHLRGARGKRWRARVGPTQLSQTGASIANLWNGIGVQYQDVDGTTRIVGPVGSGANVETDDLIDDDPTNPANQRGIRRWDLLTMQGTSTAAIATEVGRRFLEESRALDTSGKADLVGHVCDDKGVWWPYWMARSGDYISFTDAADTSERRIVHSENSHSSKTNSIDLDAPPEGLAALLERLGAALLSSPAASPSLSAAAAVVPQWGAAAKAQWGPGIKPWTND